MAIAHFLLFLVLLLIILQEADLRITYKDILRVRISLTILAITFSRTHEKNLSLAKSIKAIKNIPLLFKATKFALKRADVKVIELSRATHHSTANTILAAIPVIATISSILAYISTNARSFSIPTNQDKSESDRDAVDILFKTRVMSLIISAMIFLYYIAKRKIRRAIKNV